MTDWWVRARSTHDYKTFASDKWLTIFLPLQAPHVIRQDNKSQSELSGNGIDVKIQFPNTSGDFWTFQQALSYCEEAFREFKEHEKNKQLFILSLEAFYDRTGARYAPPCSAPNGLLSQPICVPIESVSSLITASRKDPEAYLMLYNAGLQSIRTSSLDVQPNCFKSWFGDAAGGTIKMPGKRPKAWGNISRDWMILVMLRTLLFKGLNEFRNETAEPSSAYDAIAEAAKTDRSLNITSYETVKSIVSRRKRL